jgi:tetratricopeptide (TPR) repeat protein
MKLHRVCLSLLHIALLVPLATHAAPLAGMISSCELDVSSALGARDRLEREVPVAALDAASAKAILSRPTMKDGELKMEEAKPASATKSAQVEQTKGIIKVNSESGRQWCFVNYEVPELPGMDGEAERFSYQGRFGKTPYLRIDVSSMHDSPYAHLIAPRNGNRLSFHVGNDSAVMAADGARFLMVKDNPPGFAIAALTADGPRIDLACALPRLPYNDPRTLVAEIKGWEGEQSFALALRPEAGKTPSASIALRAAYEGGSWRLAASDPEAIRRVGGFKCSEHIALPPGGAACPTGCDKLAVRTIAPALDLYQPLATMFKLALQNGGDGQDSALSAAHREIEAHVADAGKHGDRKKARQLNDRGTAKLRSGNPSEAVAEFLAAHQADPVDVEILNNLGYAEMLAGQPDAGLHLVSTLILEPGRANAWANLGHLFARREAVQEAVACFSLSLRFAARPAKTLQFLKELAAKENSPALNQSVQRLASQPWVERLTGGSASTTVPVAKAKAAPRFQDYPATRTFTGGNAAVRLESAEDQKYRTRLSQGAAGKPNFAGDYILVLWGCGSGCAEGAVIDPRTGTISWLPYFVVGCDSSCVDFADKEFIEFRADSKLLVLNGQRGSVKGRGAAKAEDEGIPGSFYYLFENGSFRLLHSVAAEMEKFDDPE